MSSPSVDVVIAVHTAARPIARAVGSVLDHTRAPVRVTVVCHEVSGDTIAELLGAHAASPHIRLVEHRDGLRSPAGPFNAGLDRATAEFTSILGSDDELEPHAIDGWLSTARRTDARAVVCKQRFTSGRLARTPITRPWRRHRLDPVRDRLAYRTAPLGLLAREDFDHIRFSTGLTTGEDIAYGLRVWFSGASIWYDRSSPGYLVHDETVVGRVTTVVRDLTDEFAFLSEVVDAPWFGTLSTRARNAIGVKLLRAHVVPAILLRARGSALSRRDCELFATIIDRVVDAGSPRCMEVLSRRDTQLLTALKTGPAAVDRAVRAYGGLLSVRALVPGSPMKILDREAPLRLLGAAATNRS